jgi:RNA polymerase sigma-70 factor (ECF subfamily)
MEPLDREILSLRHYEELTNREAAGELGITEAAASKRYVRALRRLRSVLVTLPGFEDTE